MEKLNPFSWALWGNLYGLGGEQQQQQQRERGVQHHQCLLLPACHSRLSCSGRAPHLLLSPAQPPPPPAAAAPQPGADSGRIPAPRPAEAPPSDGGKGDTKFLSRGSVGGAGSRSSPGAPLLRHREQAAALPPSPRTPLAAPRRGRRRFAISAYSPPWPRGSPG